MRNVLKLDMRRMVGIHQGRERSDVLLAIILPAVLMGVSAYTNAWTLTGGHLTFESGHLVNTLDALFRGLFVEALVFCCFKWVKALCLQRRVGSYVAALIPAAVGLVGVIVSAGCGLAWAGQSGQMQTAVQTVSLYLWPWMVGVFQAGIGLLFPIALAVCAVYDVGHLLTEHVARGAQLGGLAVQVQSAEHHQNMLLKMQKEEDEKMREHYRQIAQLNAQRAVESARQGDLTFGLEKVTQTQPRRQLPQSSVTPLNAPASTRQLPAGNGPVLLPPQQQPTIPGQVGPAPAWRSGNTQNIPVQPQMPPLPPKQNGGMYGNPYTR